MANQDSSIFSTFFKCKQNKKLKKTPPHLVSDAKRGKSQKKHQPFLTMTKTTCVPGVHTLSKMLPLENKEERLVSWLADCSTVSINCVLKTTLYGEHHSLTAMLTGLQTKAVEIRKKQSLMLVHGRETKIIFNHKLHQKILVTSQDETVWVLKFGCSQVYNLILKL